MTLGTLSPRVDHVLVTGLGPYYSSLAEVEIEKARRDVDAHLLLRVSAWQRLLVFRDVQPPLQQGSG